MPHKFISNSCDKFVHNQSTYIHSATVHNLPYSTYTLQMGYMSSSRFQSQVFFMDGMIHSGGQWESLSQLSSPSPHDGDSSKLKRHKSGIACPSMSFIWWCSLKTQPCFMNGRPYVSCMEGGIHFTMGQLSPMKSEYSPKVFLGTHVASRSRTRRRSSGTRGISDLDTW